MTATADARPHLYALLVGVDRYLKGSAGGYRYPSLSGCVRDVARVEEFLRGRLSVPPEAIVKLTSTDAGRADPPEPPDQRPTYENLVRAFDRLTARARPGDQVYVHYSGHGGRTPTVFPDAKGAGGLDESLVPLDVGLPGSRYLRDVELGTLLQRMVAKGLVVTVVLDSCHAGGATRNARPEAPAADDVAVRGVPFIDTTARPADSLVGPPDQLLAAWRSLSNGAAGRQNFLPDGRDYVVLAARLPHELAHEFTYDNKDRGGALTSYWLEALRDLGPDLTYARAHDRILARLHARFPAQTPMLLGAGARVVFGARRALAPLAVLVMDVNTTRRRVRLQTGQALGVRRDARLATYPHGTADLTRAESQTALLRVTEVGATDSWAEVVESYAADLPRPGDQAVLLGAGWLRLVRKVRLAYPDGRPAGDADDPLNGVERALRDTGWVQLAAADDGADFQVRRSIDGAEFAICDANGVPLPNLRPPLRATDPDAPRAIAGRLVHLSKYRAVELLANNDEYSPLRGKLRVELLGVQDDYDVCDRPEPRPFPGTDAVPTLRVGQWTFLRIRNESGKPLNVAALDLQPDWGIAQVFPQDGSAFEVIDPGGERLLPLQGGLPAGYADGVDTLKVFATVGAPNFRTLTLPSLDEPDLPRDATRGARGGDPLDELFAAVREAAPRTRSLDPGAVPSGGWVVADVRVRVVADPVPHSAVPATRRPH